jgi:alpha-tubulin suppressor-like RCC1 family protein
MPYSAKPLPVDLGATVVDVGMGYESTYALTEDGTIYAWGLNNRGQIGVGTADMVVREPTLVQTAAGAVLGDALRVLRSDGGDQCAEMKDRSLGSRYVCWGGDDDGELGFGTPGGQFNDATPTVVIPDNAAQLVRGENHGCVTLTDDDGVDIACWGNNLYVGNGDSTPDMDQLVPGRVAWDPEAFASLLE